MAFVTFTDGEYTCGMKVMHLGKEHIAQNSASLSGHTQPFCQSRFKLKDVSLLIHVIYYNLIIYDRKVHVYAVNMHVH